MLLTVGLFICGRYLLSDLFITEEKRILKIIDRGEEAVQNHSLFTLHSILASDYHDRSGLDKRTLIALATRYFNQQNQVHILRLSDHVEILSPTEAKVTTRIQVIAQQDGTISRGMTDDSLLGEVFEILLRKEGDDWQITAINPEKQNWPRI